MIKVQNLLNLLLILLLNNNNWFGYKSQGIEIDKFFLNWKELYKTRWIEEGFSIVIYVLNFF